jgi:hypothetical protein
MRRGFRERDGPHRIWENEMRVRVTNEQLRVNNEQYLTPIAHRRTVQAVSNPATSNPNSYITKPNLLLVTCYSLLVTRYLSGSQIFGSLASKLVYKTRTAFFTFYLFPFTLLVPCLPLLIAHC